MNTNFGKTHYYLEYRLVSKWGLDRAEIGGLDSFIIFDTFEEVRMYLNKYPYAETYKSMNYAQKAKFSDSQLFFLFVRPTEHWVEVFNKDAYVKRMRINKILINGHPIKFVLKYNYGVTYSNYSSNNLEEVWKMMKRNHIKSAKIYAVYHII